MRSENSLTSSQPKSPAKNPATSPVFDKLTSSEIEQLRQHKKELSAFAQKAFASKKGTAP